MATTIRYINTDGDRVDPGEYTITDTRVHVTAVTRPNGFTIDQQDATIVHTVTPISDAVADTNTTTDLSTDASTDANTQDTDLTLDQINTLISDDITTWMDNPFMDRDMLTEKVQWWINRAIHATRREGTADQEPGR